MFLTKKELEERLKDPANLFSKENSVIVRPEKSGSKKSSKKHDIETQATIGALAHVMPREQVEEIFDMKSAQVANLANARPSGYMPYGKVEDELLTKINEKLGAVSDVAIEKLQMSLGLISEEKLHNSKARELASVAKDMASIVDKARPVVKDENTRVPQIIFYAPRFHKEDFYEVVEVKA